MSYNKTHNTFLCYSNKINSPRFHDTKFYVIRYLNSTYFKQYLKNRQKYSDNACEKLDQTRGKRSTSSNKLLLPVELSPLPFQSDHQQQESCPKKRQQPFVARNSGQQLVFAYHIYMVTVICETIVWEITMHHYVTCIVYFTVYDKLCSIPCYSLHMLKHSAIQMCTNRKYFQNFICFSFILFMFFQLVKKINHVFQNKE